MRPDRAAYAEIADRIESELRALSAPITEFGEWLQSDLLPTLRAVADGSSKPPKKMRVGTMAVREYDGYGAADPLVFTLLDLERLMNGK